MLLSLSTSIVSINPIPSFVSFPIAGTYSASKTGVHSITQAQRRDCKPIHTMMGVYPDPIDTDMAEYAPFDKALPIVVSDAVQDALRTGTDDIFPDHMSKRIRCLGIGAYMASTLTNSSIESEITVKRQCLSYSIRFLILQL